MQRRTMGEPIQPTPSPGTERPHKDAPPSTRPSAPKIYRDKAVTNRILWFRENVRMLVGISVSSIVLLIVAGVLMITFVRRDPVRYERRGDAALAQPKKDFQRAAVAYGTALRYAKFSKDKLRLMTKLADSFEASEPASPMEAFNHYQTVLALLEESVRVDPDNRQALNRLLAQYYRLANDGAGAELWDKLFDKSDQLLKTDPASIPARKFRGISQAARMSRLQLDEKTRKQALDDLQNAAASLPDDPEVNFYTAVWHIQAARTLRGQAQEEKSQKSVDAAVKISDAFLTAHPQDAQALLNSIRIYMEASVLRSEPALRAKAMDLAVTLETRLATDDKVSVCRELAALLRGVDMESVPGPSGMDVPRGILRAIALYEAAAARHPDQSDLLFELGQLYRQVGKITAAGEMFDRAGSVRKLKVAPSIIRDRNLFIMAKFEGISILLLRFEKERDPVIAKECLAEARRRFDDFRREAQASPAVDVLEGRLEYAAGNDWKAAACFDTADTRMDRRNPELGLYIGKTLVRLEQWTAAMNRLDAVFVNPGASHDIRMQTVKEMSKVLLRLQRIPEAFRLLQTLFKVAPGDPEVRVRMAQLLEEVARHPERVPIRESPDVLYWNAIQALKGPVEQQYPDAMRRLAVMLNAVGDPVTARRLLADAVRVEPANLDMLQQLLALEISTGLDQAARERIQNRLRGASDCPPVKMLRQALAEPSRTPLAARLPELVRCALQPNPFRREFEFAKLLRSAGQGAEADAAFIRAQALGPTEFSLLEDQFKTAMARRDWVAARRIIEIAIRYKVDSAFTLFWQGQVALEQNDFKSATESFSQLTSERPLYSEAWSALGDCHRLTGAAGVADGEYLKALELKQNNMTAILGRFFLHDFWKQADKGVEDLRQALYWDPDNLGLRLMLAEYLGRYGASQEAIAIRLDAMRQRPGDDDNRRSLAGLYLSNGKPEQARILLDSLIATDPNQRDTVRLQAFYFLVKGDIDAGRAVLEKYLEVCGAAATADDWLLLARYLRQSGRDEAAIAAYEKASAMGKDTRGGAALELAGWFQNKGQYDKAVEWYRKARNQSRNTDLYASVIDLLIQQNHLDEAEKEMAAWRAVVPDGGARQAMLGAVIAKERGNREEAGRLIDAAIRSDEANAMLYLVRAQINQADPSEPVQFRVKSDLEKALQLNPMLVTAREILVDWLINRNRVDDGLDHLRRLVAARPDAPSYRVQLARQYLRLKNSQRLEDLLRESMQKLPNLAVWHQFMAMLRRDQGRMPDALAELAKAYEIQKSPENLKDYAEVLVGSGKLEPAMALFKDNAKAVEASPVLLSLRARALTEAGKGFSAEEDAAKALALAVSEHAAMDEVCRNLQNVIAMKDLVRRLGDLRGKGNDNQIDLTLSKLKLNQQDVDGAIATLEAVRSRLTKKDPLLPGTLWLLGVSYYQKQQFSKAREAYEALLVLDPENSAALNNLSYLLAEDMKRPQEALPIAALAASKWQLQEIDRANVLDTLGRIQFLCDKLLDAEDTLKRSIQLQSMAVNNLHMAEVLFARNRIIEAMDAVDKAASLVPSTGGDASMLKRIDDLKKTLVKLQPRRPMSLKEMEATMGAPTPKKTTGTGAATTGTATTGTGAAAAVTGTPVKTTGTGAAGAAAPVARGK